MMKKRNFFNILMTISLVVSLFSSLVLLGACEPTQPETREPTEKAAVQKITPSVEPSVPPTDTQSPTAAPTEQPTETPSEPPTPPPPTWTPAPEPSLVFATFKKPPVDTTAAAYHEAIAPDLSNVQVPFILSEAQRERMAQNGFVVSPGAEKEFFTLYEKARYNNEPILVTSDSLLHVYHLLFDKVLRTAEIEYFIPLLRDLNRAMLARSDEVYQAVQGAAPEWEDAARRTVAFVGVASKLLDPEVEVPAYAADLVEDELALIEGAGGMIPSPIFPGLEYGEDYTQYIPRGHYTKSEALKAYFKSMMWYGRMTFRLKAAPPEVGRAETRAALLLVHALRTAQVNGRPALEAWSNIYNPTVFFVGRSDDLTVLQYGEVMNAIYGPGAPAEALTDEALLDQFIAEANKLPPPRILGMVIMDTDDIESTTKGLRFMGQRFVPDAYIFGQLIYRNVGTPENRRGLPNGLDIPAAMGSERAYQILDELGETEYQNYPQQMEEARGWLSGLSVEEWTETLYNSWLYTFHPLLLDTPGEGYPTFMQSQAWLDKQLNTVMGSWAELKHDTILYAKQVYAELGGGPPPPPPLPPKGYVEPVPEFFARLTALTQMTREGLGSRGLLVGEDDYNLQRLEELSSAFQTMAEKELRGEPLTDDEYDIIRYYGGELEHLTMAASDTKGEGEEGSMGGQFMPEEEPQAAVVADVATDPGQGVVLEVAVGRIDELYAVVPMVEEDGTMRLQVAKGGLFSYYEFPWPMDDRLTDEAWRQALDEGSTMSRPRWIDSFYVDESARSAMGEAVARFQKSLSNAFWHISASYVQIEGEMAAQWRAEIEELESQKRYQGRQPRGNDFRSFDLQEEGLAVVTVRERWEDTMYEYEGHWPNYHNDPVVAHRGPYTLDVTYTLERDEDYNYWRVTKAVYADQPPAWEAQ